MTRLGASGIEVVAAPHLTGDDDKEHRHLNRELSWLDFNERVLALAEDPQRPLLERVKFLAIFSQNLDEFFQIRVAGLKEQSSAGLVRQTHDEMTPQEQLSAIRERVTGLTARRSQLFNDEIIPALDKEAIRFATWSDLTSEDRLWLGEYFSARIFPVLTPLAVDPAHPFPFVSSLSLNLAVVASDPTASAPHFARVKVPPSLPRFVPLPDGERFVPLEELVAGRLEALFPGMEVLAHHPFRITRDADLEVEEDEADDLLAAIETSLRQRRRSPDAVRLELASGTSTYVTDLLTDELELERTDVYESPGLLDLSALWQIYALNRPHLKDEPWVPGTQARLADVSRDHPHGSKIFDVLKAGDMLVHHPYDSFATSVGLFIEQAALDPDVLAIKWTLYRTSGPPSPIIRNLIHAAEAGKQVVALVELKARFDEEANIAWAHALEEAGVHVVYGVVGLKTHAKIALVVRQEGDELVRYTHVGTGNYNPNTATVYEDIGVLSADQDVGADLSDLFNFLTGYSRQRAFRKLLVAPLMLREQILDLISREAKRGDGRIVMKLNGLADVEIIDALYDASQRGAEIDLIIRGVCGLRPGAPGLSERIRVRSILGRFLEHSRIFRFGRDAVDTEYYIGSADLMERNLSRRVEALLPVTDAVSRARIDEILEVELSDDALAWELSADGTWHRVANATDVDAHGRFRELALARARSADADG